MKWIIGIFSLLVISLAAAGIAAAHGSGTERGYGAIAGSGMMGGYYGGHADMHEEMLEVLESGDYSDLEALREEYGMPIMYWVGSQEDLEQARQIYEQSEGDRGGYGYMPCHG